MKTFTIEDIRSWKPCYPPEKKLPEGWSGTALDILALTNVAAGDKLWVVLRSEVLSDKVLRLFAVKSARRVQHLMPDARSLKALDVAEAYAHGKATKEELEKARNDASAAAWDAPLDATLSAVYAAWAACAVTRPSAEDAAIAAIAAIAFWATEREAQLEILRELIKEYE